MPGQLQVPGTEGHVSGYPALLRGCGWSRPSAQPAAGRFLAAGNWILQGHGLLPRRAKCLLLRRVLSAGHQVTRGSLMGTS